jgi:hypothetical protein
LTDPVLAAGVITPAKVAYGDFLYRISSYTYSGEASETVLSGSDVPANLYGAWRLEIEDDGTITCIEAAANATGYLTPALAILGLPLRDSSHAPMGFVTTKNTAGVFDPGTTSLSAATVTATFTDGDPSERSRPMDILLASRTVYIRPKPDDIYLIGATKLIKGTALGVSDVLPDSAWGPALAHCVAIYLLILTGNVERAAMLMPIYDTLKSNLELPNTRQMLHKPTIIRRF